MKYNNKKDLLRSNLFRNNNDYVPSERALSRKYQYYERKNNIYNNGIKVKNLHIDKEFHYFLDDIAYIECRHLKNDDDGEEFIFLHELIYIKITKDWFVKNKFYDYSYITNVNTYGWREQNNTFFDLSFFHKIEKININYYKITELFKKENINEIKITLETC